MQTGKWSPNTNRRGSSPYPFSRTPALRPPTKPVHGRLPPDSSRLDAIECVSFALKRQQLDLLPERAQRMEERLSLHVYDAAVLGAEV